MKIIQVCPRYYPDIGGIETHVKEISERFVQFGHSVEVVCTDPSGILPLNDSIKGVKITRFRSFAPYNAYYFSMGITRYLKSCEYDVIHAHGYHAFPALFAKMAAQNKKFVFTPHYHGKGHTPFRTLLLGIYNIVGKTIFNRADRILCDSEYEKRLIKHNFNIDDERMVVVPMGLNLKEFVYNTSTRDPKRLLYIGRIEKYKGIQHIIKALPHLQGYSLVIVGKGPYEKELRVLARKIGVTERITWKKDISREDLLKEYANAEFFISLSSHEAYGITVAEALASGLKVIVNKHSALEEFIDQRTCLGITPNAENIIDAIRTMKTDANHERYKKRILDWDEVANKIMEVYCEILNR